MEKRRNHLTDEQVTDISDRSAAIQAQYITDLAKLSDEFRLDRNAFINGAVEILYEYVKEADFSKMTTD